MGDEESGEFIGKTVLIGITYMTHDDQFISQDQFYGEIVSYHSGQGIEVRLKGRREGEVYRLPPDLKQLHWAEHGEYKLRATGEVVVDPDFTTSWTSKRAAPIH
jgi:hypothetical protein